MAFTRCRKISTFHESYDFPSALDQLKQEVTAPQPTTTKPRRKREDRSHSATLARKTRHAAIAEEVREVSPAEVAVLRRAQAEESAALLEGNAVAAEQQGKEQQQRAKRVQIFEDRPITTPDTFKCPRCFYHNYYHTRACNKLDCGNCHTKFCIVCGRPAAASCRCIAAAWAR